MIKYYTFIKLICPHILKENERTVIVKIDLYGTKILISLISLTTVPII